MNKYRFFLRIAAPILLAAIAVIFTGCGGGSGTTNGTVSGTAIKGPVANADVMCFSVNANGLKGSAIGAGQTDGQGNFSMPVGDYSGPVFCQMTRGNYMDEATGTIMQMHQNDMMTCTISFMSAGATVNGIQITPLTSMAQSMAENMTGGMTSENITAVNNAVGNYFNINDILHTQPMNPLIQGAETGADQSMMNYGMALAAMSQYANMTGMSFSSGIVTAMMQDASDGHMNGMMGGTGVMMGGGMMGGGSPMHGDAGTSGLGNAMMEFIQSPMNKSGVTVQDMMTLINKLNSSNGIIL